MEKSAKVRVKGTELTLKPALEKEIEKHYNQTYVSMICLLDARVEVTGTVTGNLYVFHGAGSLGINSGTGQEGIDIRDKDELLDKKRGRACCGGISGTSLFELVS